MDVTGKLHAKFDTQKVSDKFQKREFVLITEWNTPYPQYVAFQVTQDKCDILDSFTEGTEVQVQFNLRGREWNGPQGVKYFNTLEAWRIVDINAEHHHANSAPTFNSGNPNDQDDLPF
jgi:uncharacterized protein DUF3127